MSMVHLLAGANYVVDENTSYKIPIQSGSFTPEREEIKLKSTASLGYDFISLAKRNNSFKFQTNDYKNLMLLMNNSIFRSAANEEYLHIYIGSVRTTPSGGLIYDNTKVVDVKFKEPLIYIDNISGNINEAIEINCVARGFETSSSDITLSNFTITHGGVISPRNFVIGNNTFNIRNFTLNTNLEFYDHFGGNIDPEFSMIKSADIELTMNVLANDVISSGLLTGTLTASQGTLFFNYFENKGQLKSNVDGNKIVFDNPLITLTNKDVNINEITTCEIKLIATNLNIYVEL